MDGSPATRRGEPAHVLVLPVLGIPVRYETDDALVAEIAEASFGGWRALEAAPHLIDPEPVVVRVAVIDGDEGGVPHAPLRYMVPDLTRVLIASPGSNAVADGLRRESRLFVTRELLHDREHFRYGMFESATVAVLSQFDRVPVHAAAVVRGDVALLLAAPSGVGKSTLTYAAARAGLAVLAEDLVYLQSRPELRVWGLPGWLHVSESAAAHFPELRGAQSVLLANGKRKIAVRAEALGAFPPLPVARRAGICLLRRDGSATELTRLDPETIAGHFAGAEPGFDLFADQAAEPIRRLAAQGGWRLNMGSPPAELVQLLHEMLDTVEASTAPD